jgi:hypothetical protein
VCCCVVMSRCPAAVARGWGGGAVIGWEGERCVLAVLVSHNDCRWHCSTSKNFSLLFFFKCSIPFLT